MIAWIGLLKKDFQLNRMVFFVGTIINILVLTLALLVDINPEEPTDIFIPLMLLVFLHVLYLPIVFLINLKTEGKQLHLWLHNPQPAITLLGSKLLNALLKMIVSLTMLYGMIFVLLRPRFHFIEVSWTDLGGAALLLFLYLVLISTYLGIWFIFFWTLHQILKKRMGRWSWLVIFILVISSSWMFLQIKTTQMYQLLTQWGDISFIFPTFEMDPFRFYGGEYLLHFIITMGLFYISAWLIDNKVEV